MQDELIPEPQKEPYVAPKIESLGSVKDFTSGQDGSTPIPPVTELTG